MHLSSAALTDFGLLAGSYFICDEEGTNVAVFKPEDEEPLAVNNPKGGGSSADCNGSGLRRGIKQSGKWLLFCWTTNTSQECLLLPW